MDDKMIRFEPEFPRHCFRVLIAEDQRGKIVVRERQLEIFPYEPGNAASYRNARLRAERAKMKARFIMHQITQLGVPPLSISIVEEH